MPDFWDLDPSTQTFLALIQQCEKLKSDALATVFKLFNSSAMELSSSAFSDSNYRFLAADSSICNYFSTPFFSSDNYYCSLGNLSMVSIASI